MRTYIQALLMTPSPESALAVIDYFCRHPEKGALLTEDEKQVVINAINATLSGRVPPGALANVH